jgi:hypothetical protein
MTTNQNKTDQLAAFRQRDKFSDQAWNKRGLNPSGFEISSKLTALFNQCASALIDAIEKNASDRQLKAILKSHLANFSKRDYDTEEIEFICDLFHELAQILSIDFADTLNRWLYGSVMSTLLKIHATLNPQKVVDTIKQTCPTCGGAIDTFIMKREEGIPDFSWHIVQCKNCNDYLLVSFGPNVKQAKFGNYIPIETLRKDEFTREQAEIRLEQIRYFRK